jgi:uncharacterized protein YaiI (UPF0178 family)
LIRQPDIYIDADACPYKEETYKVAKRYSLTVFTVCNSEQRIPIASWIKPVVVGTGFDAVDDYIAEHAQAGDIVVTNDLLLSERCVRKQVRVIDTRGKEVNEDNIGELLATRELMATLRQMGPNKFGPKPAKPKYRSDFLSKLDQMINAIKRGA